MTELSKLKLYATYPHPCSYLEGEDATTLFVDPKAQLDANIYGQLSRLGFRRSGNHVYRPRCENCQACIPIRVVTPRFKPNRNQKRCAKRNADLQVHHRETIDIDEHYQLYEKYISVRHDDGDMYPPSIKQYEDFLSPMWGITRYLEFRTPSNKLVAVGVCDLLKDGPSAIYTFFDPEESNRSLGVYSVLYQIAWAQQLGLPFVYLGYWIKQSTKMLYKTNYRPFQIFLEHHWVSVDDPENISKLITSAQPR